MPQSRDRIDIQEVRELGFHNRHTLRPALRYVLNLPDSLEFIRDPIPRPLVALLESLLPALSTTRLKVNDAVSPLPELLASRAQGFAWVTAALAAMLQRDAYPMVANFGSTRSEPGTASFYFEFQDVAFGRFCASTAIQLAAVLLQRWGSERMVDAEVALRGILADHAVRSAVIKLNQNQRAILEKADERGIPWKRIVAEYPYVQLGHGRALHRLRETVTDQEGTVAVELQKSKILGNHALAAAGLPTPKAVIARSAEHAAEAARSIGYPVVLKPNSLGKGVGVLVGLTTDQEVRAAFQEVERHGGGVTVEKYIAGDDHRILVVDGKFTAAAQRLPARVIGDGRSSVRQLVETANRDPRRGKGYTALMNVIVVDTESTRLLRLAGMTVESVPAEGQVVELKRTANLSSGGTAIDVTDEIHPDNIAMAERAARVIGLRIAGVDYLTPDISRSHLEVGGAICEINAAVGLRPHLVSNPGRDILNPILEQLFPKGESGRIPIAAVTGTTGKTTTSRMLSRILAEAGLTVGTVTTDEVRVGEEIVALGDLAGVSGAELVFADRRCDVAVLETARGGIIQRGLAFDSCDVAALTNVGEDHLGEHEVETPEQMARHKARLLHAAERAVVLNANDPLCLAQREGLRAERILLAAPEGANEATERHLEDGGEVFLLEARRGAAPQLVLCRGKERTKLLSAKELPSTLGGGAPHNAKNALFAAALAHAMGQPFEAIRAGLKAFKPDLQSSPGRLSMVEGLPFALLVDFAHNAAQLETVVKVIDGMKVQGRRIGLLTVPGNRRDSDIVASGAAAAGHFDRYICYERKDWWRGRPAGQIAELLNRGLADAGIAADAIEAGLEQEAAIARAVELARPGDFVTIFGSASTTSVPQFERAVEAAAFSESRRA
jgi:cyanophycin synthetase